MRPHTWSPHLGYLGMGTAAVPRGGVHPAAALRQLQRRVGIRSAGALLPEGALLLLHAPATFEPGVGLQAHAAAVPQSSALIEVG